LSCWLVSCVSIYPCGILVHLGFKCHGCNETWVGFSSIWNQMFRILSRINWGTPGWLRNAQIMLIRLGLFYPWIMWLHIIQGCSTV
jgi:hypothetical protein